MFRLTELNIAKENITLGWVILDWSNHKSRIPFYLWFASLSWDERDEISLGKASWDEVFLGEVSWGSLKWVKVSKVI